MATAQELRQEELTGCVVDPLDVSWRVLLEIPENVLGAHLVHPADMQSFGPQLGDGCRGGGGQRTASQNWNHQRRATQSQRKRNIDRPLETRHLPSLMLRPTLFHHVPVQHHGSLGQVDLSTEVKAPGPLLLLLYSLLWPHRDPPSTTYQYSPQLVPGSPCHNNTSQVLQTQATKSDRFAPAKYQNTFVVTGVLTSCLSF